jgi:hypothetical protein
VCSGKKGVKKGKLPLGKSGLEEEKRKQKSAVT